MMYRGKSAWKAYALNWRTSMLWRIMWRRRFKKLYGVSMFSDS